MCVRQLLLQRNENVIDRNGTTVHLVGQIKHHLEEMIRQLMDSGITMDRMRLNAFHSITVELTSVCDDLQAVCGPSRSAKETL